MVFRRSVVLIIYSWRLHRRIVSVAAFTLPRLSLLVAPLVNVNVLPGIELNDSSNRIMATASAFLTGTDTSHNVGLRDLNFRSRVYEGVLSDLGDSSLAELIVGHGTSTGGNAMLRAYPANYRLESIDPNRVIHNEWLRAIYEWGGRARFALYHDWHPVFRTGHSVRASPTAIARFFPRSLFLPAFIAALSTENVLAGAGNAVTLGFALTVAVMWSPVESVQQHGALGVRKSCDPH